MQPEIFTLKNGLRVLFVDTKAFPTLTTLLLVGAGSRFENKNNNGIAHFLEHMFFKGSKKYPSPEIVSSEIEGMGGVWNAFTSKHYTGYFIKGASDHFEKMIDILSDILLNSLFAEKEIAKEKGVVIEEINMYEDQPQAKVGEIFENLMYKGNPLGMDVIGTKETVGSFTRETITNYKRSLYSPNNSVLILAGGLIQNSKVQFKIQKYNLKFKNKETKEQYSNIAIEQYLHVIENKFGSWKQDNFIGYEKYSQIQAKSQSLVHYKKTEQAHFCLGYPTFGIKDERKYALSILATILGGGASSRLFVEIREKRGLCYYIHTDREHFQETGYIMTQAGVTKEKDKIKQAVGAVVDEHEKIAKIGATKEELRRAKEMLKGRLLLSLEDSFNVANFFGMKQLLEKSPESPEELIDKIEKVTGDQVKELAKEIFVKEKLNFTVIGPLRENDFHGF